MEHARDRAAPQPRRLDDLQAIGRGSGAVTKAPAVSGPALLADRCPFASVDPLLGRPTRWAYESGPRIRFWTVKSKIRFPSATLRPHGRALGAPDALGYATHKGRLT